MQCTVCICVHIYITSWLLPPTQGSMKVQSAFIVTIVLVVLSIVYNLLSAISLLQYDINTSARHLARAAFVLSSLSFAYGFLLLLPYVCVFAVCITTCRSRERPTLSLHCLPLLHNLLWILSFGTLLFLCILPLSCTALMSMEANANSDTALPAGFIAGLCAINTILGATVLIFTCLLFNEVYLQYTNLTQ